MMKKFLFGLLALAAAVSCGQKQDRLLVPAENFADTLDGKAVRLYTLRKGDIILQVTNYGGRVVSLLAPDREGNLADVAIGHNTLEAYVHPVGERFLGACVGPVANRIGGASFTLDGQTFQTPKNDNGANTLHGGFIGLDHVVWDVVAASDEVLFLEYTHPDGQEGFPGNLKIRMGYSLTDDNEFVVVYGAETDKPTPVNLTHHPFFNLAGEGGPSVEGHLMWIDADAFTPIDSLSIPTGEILPVQDTPFDFRQEHAIGEMIAADDPQIANGRGYDHNWCLNGEAGTVRKVATVYEPESGRFLEVLTDQPGLQFYSGNFFDGTTLGKNGKPIVFRGALALEAQKYPDSPNQPGFTDVTLRPGQHYNATTVYRFSAH